MQFSRDFCDFLFDVPPCQLFRNRQFGIIYFVDPIGHMKEDRAYEIARRSIFPCALEIQHGAENPRKSIDGFQSETLNMLKVRRFSRFRSRMLFCDIKPLGEPGPKLVIGRQSSCLPLPTAKIPR